MNASPESYLPNTAGRGFSLFVWKNRVLWFFLLFTVSVVVDQGSKIWAQGELAVERETTRVIHVDGEPETVTEMRFRAKPAMELIPTALNFRYAENPAAAFSLTQQIPVEYRRPLLVCVSFLAMILLAVFYFKQERADGLLMTAFALIVGGAMGNFIDRVRFGYVVDFIDAYAGFINPSWPHWPTFNIADSCIVVGALLVLFRTFRPLYDENAEAIDDAASAGA